MAKTKLVADWKEIDPSSLNTELKAAYDAYKAQYAKAKAQRDVFEAAMNKAAELPATHRLAFGYNFGKLSAAVVPNTGPSVSKKAVSFDSLKAA
jgi:hypothetical protein